MGADVDDGMAEAEAELVIVTTKGLGRLEAVPVRSVWNHEAHNFTPWLLGNADRLGEALGIDIEFDAAEHAVGGFSLDLIGRDLTNDSILMVENQLEGTDHIHLGQVVTYAAGTGASTVVWIATSFRDEHRQALDWLNSQTNEDTHFFGVELGLVRIGNSEPAPILRVVAQPNDWQKVVRASAAAAPHKEGSRGALYRAFWAKYLDRVHSEHPHWTKAKVAPTDNWMTQPSFIRGTTFAPVFSQGAKLRSELYIDTGDKAENEALFDALFTKRSQIETNYGRELDWQRLENRRACRITDITTGDVGDEASHDAFIEWLLQSGDKLRAALKPFEHLAGTPGTEGKE
jgi:hypothetical protein